MNKYKHKIPRDDLKRFAKEIAKKLVLSDFNANRVKDPTKIDDKQQKKVKDFCKQFFDKAAYKHKKHEEERAARKGKKDTSASTPATQSPTADQDLSPDLKKEDSGDEDVKMSDHEDNKPTPDTPSEPGTLKRKRGDSSPVVKDETEDDPTKSIYKKLNVETPPPPPPPPAPPVETPPALTPRDDMEIEADLHDEGDTNFKDKSMADVQALAQQEGDDDDEVMGDLDEQDREVRLRAR
jgi:[histone H3]-lysine36 N-trimethyltransferase